MQQKHKVTPLGSLLRRIREQRGITQLQMAKDIGMQANGLSHIEYGKQTMSIEQAEKIIKCYELDQVTILTMHVLRSNISQEAKDKILKLIVKEEKQ